MSTYAEPSAADPRSFDEPLNQVLAVLVRAKRSTAEPWMGAAAISASLRDDFGIALHWRTIYTMLLGNSRLVSRKRASGTWLFCAMSAADDLVMPERAVELIDPQNALRSVLSLHDILARLRGTVRVCDAYVDRRTIEHLEAIDRSASIRLLTKQVHDEGVLRRIVAAAQQNRSLELRVGVGEAIHDRYVIDDDSMLLIGTSLNALGKKQSFVVRVGQDVRRWTGAAFDEMWQRGKPL